MPRFEALEAWKVAAVLIKVSLATDARLDISSVLDSLAIKPGTSMQYHTHSVGPDVHAFRTGFATAVALARKSELNELILLVHTVQMLQGGVYEEVLGEKFVNNLAKNKVAGVEGVRIHLETERVRSAAKAAVVFAPFVSEKLLAKAVADRRAHDLVYVPWAEQERAAYLERYPNSKPL